MSSARLVIQRGHAGPTGHSYSVTFLPATPVTPAWAQQYVVHLAEEDYEHLSATAGRVAECVALGLLDPALELVVALGRLLTHYILPEPLRLALNRLPPAAPLLIATDVHEFPWELLRPGEAFLAFERPVTRQFVDGYSKETDAFERMLRDDENSPAPEPSLLLIANPQGDLDASDVEAGSILDVIDAQPHYVRCTALFRGQASRSAVLSALGGDPYTLVHYSGHNESSGTPGHEQNLRLADGPLSASNLNAALAGGPLVFLNACGSARIIADDGLVPALLRAGARGCVGALWPVNDLPSAHFSKVFYQAIFRGLSLGEAARRARVAVHLEEPHDPTWAAFVVFGDPDWRPVVFAQPESRLATVLAANFLNLSELRTIHEWAFLPAELLQRLSHAVNAFGGEVRRLDAGGLLATFGLAEPQENQARHAVHAGLTLQETAQAAGLEIAAAIATGNVVTQGGANVREPAALHSLMVGTAVDRAIELARRAAAGQILANPAAVQATTHEFEWTPHDVDTHRLASVRPSGWDVPNRVPLIGREAELDTLLTYWRRSRQRGQRQVVGLVGEAGIGKTRLLLGLRAALAETGEAPVQWIGVGCPSYLSGEPFALLRALLSRALGLAAGAPLAAWRAALADLVDRRQEPAQIDLPLLEQCLNLHQALSEGREVAESVRRAQLAAAIRTVLFHFVAAGPVILAIDDIYQADEPSLDILNQLIDSLDQVPLFLLALYRREWLPPWANKRRCHTIDLDELEPDHSAKLLALLLPEDAPPEIRQTILTRAGGNPFYLEQLAQVVRDTAAVGSGEANPLPINLPGSLRLAIQSRVARLPSAIQSVLKLAAVAGSPCEPPLLGAVLEQTGEAANLEATLNELVHQDFLRAGHAGFAFYHPLMEEVIYADLPNVQRQTLHRRLADALASTGAASPARLAWHRLRSVSRPQSNGASTIDLPPFGPHYPALVIDTLRHAGETAWRGYANRDAARWFRAGLDLLAHAPVLAGAARYAWACHAGTGKALGRLGEFDAAVHHLLEAFTGFEQLQDATVDDRLVAADLARQIGRLRMRQGRYRESLDWMARARGLALACPPPPAAGVQAHIEVHTGSVFHWQGDLDQAADHYQAGIALGGGSEAVPSPALAEGYNGLGVIQLERGQVDDAVVCLERAASFWLALGDLYEVTRVQENLGNAYFARNHWSLAQEQLRQSLAFWERIDDRNHIAYSLVNLGGVYLCQGRWSDVEACYTRALELWETVGEVRMTALAHINLGRFALATKRFAEAHENLRKALDILDRQAVDNFRAEAYMTLAELYLQENEPDQALIWGSKAVDAAQRQSLLCELGIAQRVLGQAHRMRQELEQSEALLADSLASLEATPNRHELARTWVALAALDRELGKEDQARRRLAQAEALFAELGADPDRQLVLAILGPGQT